VAPKATRGQEEERKSEARKESESPMRRHGYTDSPREDSEAREERARRRCGGEPREESRERDERERE